MSDHDVHTTTGYLRTILRHDLLPAHKEKRLLSLAKGGDEKALDMLVAHNMRLVYRIAVQYTRDALMGMTINDLCQEGVIGLISAIHKYDPTRGIGFANLAALFIKYSILNAFYANRLIIIPKGTSKVLKRVRKIQEDRARLGLKDTIEEIAVELQYNPERIVSADVVKGCISLDHHSDFGELDVEHLMPDLEREYGRIEDTDYFSYLLKNVLSAVKSPILKRYILLKYGYGLSDEEIKDFLKRIRKAKKSDRISFPALERQASKVFAELRNTLERPV